MGHVFRIVLVLICINCTAMSLCASQEMGNIQGFYRYSFPVTTGANITLQLNEDHHFDYAQYGIHNKKTISKGYYFVKQDTLLLFHGGIKHPRLF